MKNIFLRKLIWSKFHVYCRTFPYIRNIHIYIISQPSIMLLMLLKFMLNEVLLWLFYPSKLDSDLIISAPASSNVRNNYFCYGEYFHSAELWAICEDCDTLYLFYGVTDSRFVYSIFSCCVAAVDDLRILNCYVSVAISFWPIAICWYYFLEVIAD